MGIITEYEGSDRELIDRSLDNDAAAFEKLFLRHKDAILGMYLKRGSTLSDANDLLQETFVKVYLNLHRYNREFTFSQWVTAIARNTLIDQTRKHRENFVSLDQEQPGGARMNLPSNIPTPEENLIQSQNIREFNIKMKQLPIKYRRILEMRYLQEYSYEEIAERLDLPIGTVKTRIHRAKENFFRMVCKEDF
ncbi:MAG: sigma-70 family RNA polymerase sigma factor [Rikenellaceae bacterium]|jgi:RNA polymerase sigma-70 factor (ECF subfamily)|nr:sigma-70 family RNA polymerase sigma factor [Rikenellaceae bacterium]